MKYFLVRFAGSIYHKVSSVFKRCEAHYLLSCLKSHGKNCYMEKNCSLINSENISMGENVYIGEGVCMMAAEAEIEIGNHVMIAAGSTIVTGNHRINVVGEYMDQVTEKEENDDLPVIIEDDVWIAKNAIILKGVVIGRGSVIGAGSIITKSVPPYSICYADATKPRKMRFDDDTIEKHERLISEKYD